MTSRSLLIVNYRSAALTADAIRTGRAASTEPLQVVVVDNSCDPTEADALRSHADVVVVSGTNRGYAGGINLGRRSCDGEILIVSNPDVIFGPGAIDTLVVRDAAVAGPALFWDDDQRWLLPPADPLTAFDKLDEVLSSRSRAWFRRRDRRRFSERVAFWSLQRPSRVRALSGAVMAIRASAFDEAGGFDERFALYFEETDFLRRIAERGGAIEYVPTAKCRHLYNQSAGQIATASAAHYAESEMRYLEKWNGPLVARTLKRLERPFRWTTDPAVAAPLKDVEWEAGLPVIHFACASRRVVVEASPLPSFNTAAGCFPAEDRVAIPAGVWLSLRGDVLYIRAVERDSGRVLAAVRAVK
jgi:N-acetylglucosaminyl-diphospho-decaprenol L-rhamnosyltransferase